MSRADFKVIVIGPPDAGKTALMERFVNNTFTAGGQNTSTLGVSFVLKRWNGVHLAIWDTAGQEKFASLNSFYARDAAAAIIAFDLTDRIHFDEIAKWFKYLEGSSQDVIKVVVGCKYDLIEQNVKERAVSEAEGHALAKKYNAVKYIETSAKTGRNVVDVFDSLCEQLRPGSGSLSASRSSNPTSPTGTNTITLGPGSSSSRSPQPAPKNSGNCCS